MILDIECVKEKLSPLLIMSRREEKPLTFLTYTVTVFEYLIYISKKHVLVRSITAFFPVKLHVKRV